jgi:hypothetical protein
VLPTLVAAPSTSATPVPTAVAASPLESTPPDAAPSVGRSKDDEVPVPLALLAGALVLGSGSSVAVAGRRRPAAPAQL